MGGTVIVSRLKEGKYPAWREILPKKPTATVELPVEPFFAAIRQAAVMTEADNRKVVFHFAPGKLTLSAQAQSTAARSKVELAVGYDGPEMRINFDPAYLVEMLKAVDPKTDLSFDLVNPERPALFRQGERYLYLVCPLT
jgi:DNA polymerase-3 subunit beta